MRQCCCPYPATIPSSNKIRFREQRTEAVYFPLLTEPKSNALLIERSICLRDHCHPEQPLFDVALAPRPLPSRREVAHLRKRLDGHRFYGAAPAASAGTKCNHSVIFRHAEIDSLVVEPYKLSRGRSFRQARWYFPRHFHGAPVLWSGNGNLLSWSKLRNFDPALRPG